MLALCAMPLDVAASLLDDGARFVERPAVAGAWAVVGPAQGPGRADPLRLLARIFSHFLTLSPTFSNFLSLSRTFSNFLHLSPTFSDLL